MSTSQAIKLLEFHQSWLRESGEGESPISTWRLDDAIDTVLWAAKQYLQKGTDVTPEPSPSRPQESDAEPTPEPFTPKEGDFLIAIDPCVIEGGRHDGMASLTVNNEYRVMEDFGWLIVVINDFAERHEFTLETIHKYFKRKE